LGQISSCFAIIYQLSAKYRQHIGSLSAMSGDEDEGDRSHFFFKVNLMKRPQPPIKKEAILANP
jgi:hypothetical protein